MKKPKFKILMFFLVFLLIQSPISCFASQSNGKTLNSNLKIDSEVIDAFSKDEFVKVLIELDKQVDTTKIYKDSINKAGSCASPYKKKMLSRYAIVDSLKSTSNLSQKELLKYLSKEKKNGNVKEFKNFYIVNMIYTNATKEVINNVANLKNVKHIYLNRKIKNEKVIISKDISKPAEDSQWSLNKIGVPSVWNKLGITGKGIVVGIIDTGMTWNHEALKEKWRGYNPNDPDNPNPAGNWFDATDEGNPLPCDIPSLPHGTHVTGTILGQDPAGKHKIGVAPDAKWIGAKALKSDGGESVWLLNAGQWMLAPNDDPSLAPDIINNSWGGDAGKDEWYRAMVKNWRNAGILPVFAAGNTETGSVPGSVSVPSNYPECFTVAATDINNMRGDFSNQGPAPYDEVKPNISAPGVNITSSVPTGYEEGWQGTSMAAPHIAGTAALLLSSNNSLTPDQLEQIMVDTATPLTDNQYPNSPNFGYGVGLVNALSAVSSVVSGLGTIEGKVTREGNDSVAPEITHDAINFFYDNLDIPINATIKDDVSVVKANILVKAQNSDTWNTIPFERTSGDYKNGAYSAVIPHMLVKEPGIQYKIEAIDFGGNKAETKLTDVKIDFGIKPDEYSTDFSQYPTGYILNGDWQWGKPLVGPKPIKGENVLGTNLTGPYSNNTQSTLVLPPIDLRNVNVATLYLKHWLSVENFRDLAAVGISTDSGATWKKIYQFQTSTKDWEDLVIDLNDYAKSQKQIFISLTLMSDEKTNFDGWYIDDIVLKGADTTAPGPITNLTAEAKNSGIYLSWTSSTSIDTGKYNIYRSKIGSQEDMTLIGSSPVNLFTDSKAKSNTSYTYTVKACDFSGNESIPCTNTTITSGSSDPIYFSDFENDNGGWISGGDKKSWQWGTPCYGNLNPCSGKKVWGTVLDGFYDIYLKDDLESPEIDLTNFTSPKLNFNNFYEFAGEFDGGDVCVSTDNGVSWNKVKSFFPGSTYSWENITVDLAKYVGQKIKIKFSFQSDYEETALGWYIDDVLVYNGEGKETPEHPLPEDPWNSTKALNSKKTNNLNKSIAFDLYKDPASYKFHPASHNDNPSGLPLDAVVTILETGKSARTNPQDATFKLMHKSSEADKYWTVRVESYGYATLEEKIQLKDRGVLTKNFTLTKLNSTSVYGSIVDERTNKPVEGAIVKLAEDPRVTFATTDAAGNYKLDDVLEGNYTLKILAAGYEEKNIPIKVQTSAKNEFNAKIKNFVAIEDNLIYDDDSCENMRVLTTKDCGWGVKMTPKKYGQLEGVNLYVYGEDFPKPGDNKLAIAVYDSLSNGEPNKIVLKTDVKEVNRGAWNFIDLSKYAFSTNKNFYVVMLQLNNDPNCPAMGFDENGTLFDRSYVFHDNKFEKLDKEMGNVMIRAKMNYLLDTPVIKTPSNDVYTNQGTIVVSGSVNNNSVVNIYNNDIKVGSVNAKDNLFSFEVSLTEGKNIIKTSASVDSKETGLSNSVTVTKDTIKPVLTITSPEDNTNIQSEIATIAGKAEDLNLRDVCINGTSVELNKDGTFSKKIIVEQGENTITVTATDAAGNSTSKTLTVNFNNNPVPTKPTITNIKPDHDIIASNGDTVSISFDSDNIGGTAFFNIVVPDTKALLALPLNKNLTRVQMQETKPGHYEGSWVIPKEIKLKGALVQLEISDECGNKNTAIAPGKLYTNNVAPDEYPINITDVNVIKKFGSVIVEANIQNMTKDTQSPLLIIRVDDENGVTRTILTAKASELLTAKSLKLGLGFNTPNKGTYTVKLFVWDTLDGMHPLAYPKLIEFSI